MSLNNYKDTMNRLISILNLKKYSCQMKLAEYNKIENLRDTLIKYDNNPAKGLIELNDKELINLFTEFTRNNYSADDLEVYKYWINEGWANPLIKDSSQYKKSYKIFNELIDRIQVYLDYTRTFDLNKELIINELNIIDSLRDKLVNNTIVNDLVPYYPIFIENETISFNDIYEYLVSIINNNLELINCRKEYTIKNDISKESVDSISKLLLELIDSKKKIEQSDNYILDKINELTSIINKVETNIDFLYDIYPSNIVSVMEGLWDEDDIKYYKERLAIPITLIKGKIKGLDMKLTKDDSNIINEFIDDLKDKLNKLKNEETEYNKNILSSNESIKKLNNIYNALNDSNTAITSDNIRIIVNSYINSSKDYKSIIDMINTINNLNLNRLYNNENVILEKNSEKDIDKRELKKLEILFNKYKYNFEAFPKKLIDELIINSNYDHIREVMEYINSIDKFSFINEFISVIGNSEIDQEIKDLRASQICFILAYSDINIISNLVKISDNDSINLYDIFSISKVFSSKKNKIMPGVYEDFLSNETLIKEEYPELLNEFMNNYPSIFGTDSDLFKKNIELTKLYGMNINKNNDYTIPSPLALQTPDFEYVIDRYIEINKYDLVEKYRNLLGTNNINDISKRYMEEKGIDIEKNRYYKLKKEFSSDITKYLSGLSIENIPVALTDSLIKKLDKLNEVEDDNLKNICYKFKGIYISKNKTLKYYSTLLINKYKDKKEALLYSMTKDSFLTEAEFKTLKSLI